MKNAFLTTTLGLTFMATSAHAGEYRMTDGLADVPAASIEAYETCVNAQEGTSKAIRACTKTIKHSVPNKELRSNLYLKRGLLNLDAGDYKDAARDFKSAGKLNRYNEYATLGAGFSAMMREDYRAALDSFNDCGAHNSTAPLAMYGRAMTKEMQGDRDGAKADYKRAAELKPGWQAPQVELVRMTEGKI